MVPGSAHDRVVDGPRGLFTMRRWRIFKDVVGMGF